MNPTVILWNTAVFLASVFGALIVGCTLKPKFGKRVTGFCGEPSPRADISFPC